jgi:hypothetical protein
MNRDDVLRMAELLGVSSEWRGGCVPDNVILDFASRIEAATREQYAQEFVVMQQEIQSKLDQIAAAIRKSEG